MSCKKMFLSSLAVVFVAFAITVFTAGVSYGMNHSGNITSNRHGTPLITPISLQETCPYILVQY